MDKFSLRSRKSDTPSPRLNYWGCNSDYGLLTDVLVGPVENFKWLKTSSVSKKTLRRNVSFDISVATKQYNEMLSAYRSANVTVHCLKADPDLPYQVFARDSSIMTPFGAVITNMAQWWRKGENYRAIETYSELGIPIFDYITAGHFEGGDFNMIAPDCVLIGWEGDEGRSQEQGAVQLKNWFEAEGWEVFLIDIDPFYVHIDLMVVMLAEKLAAVCLETTDPKVIDWLKSKKIDFVTVPFQETIDLGCNVVALGNDRILLPEKSFTLKQKLRAHGFTLYDPDLSMITQGGGGVHCMCQSLRREESNHS